jgi:hypothetical protein
MAGNTGKKQVKSSKYQAFLKRFQSEALVD